jgi:hypothetical protein
MQPDKSGEYIVIIPAHLEGPGLLPEAVQAALEQSFPNYSFRVMGAAALTRTYQSETPMEHDEHLIAMPVMNSRAAGPGPGNADDVMILRGLPDPNETRAINAKLAEMETRGVPLN